MSASANSYKIGQVVYVIINKEMKVYPMRVIQEITKRSLKGAEITYMLVGNPTQNQQVALSDIAGEVFNSDVEAKKALINRATRSINQLVDNAVKKANEWFPDVRTSKPDSDPHVESLFTSEQEKVIDEEDGTALVDMGDGTMAKVKLPSGV